MSHKSVTPKRSHTRITVKKASFSTFKYNTYICIQIHSSELRKDTPFTLCMLHCSVGHTTKPTWCQESWDSELVETEGCHFFMNISIVSMNIINPHTPTKNDSHTGIPYIEQVNKKTHTMPPKTPKGQAKPEPQSTSEGLSSYETTPSARATPPWALLE